MTNSDSTELQKLYIAYFGRPGDPSGINYWLTRSSDNYSIRDISSELSRQDEYTVLTKDKSLEFKINKFYLNLFNRKADFNSLNYWLEKSENKYFLISDIVDTLLELKNKHYEINTWQEEQDRTVLRNKVQAAEMFTKQISGSISLINLYQPESLSPWISGNSLKKVSDFISTVNHFEASVQEVEKLIISITDPAVEILKNPAVEMKGISLAIPIYYLENRYLTKRFAKKVMNLTGGELDQSEKTTHIIALNDINLKIMKGERVGLIGHNGSGKSSFLRLISGIYAPTKGKINISVDVYPMLQKTFLTSTELSGVDACKAHYLLKKHSLVGFESFLSEIVEFSGLGSYISLPIKTYSEGMSARLIFSILTSSPHDCLAIDEGFGTGDADFYDRAEERMKQFMESAATLFLASHSEELLKQFCNRGIVFRHGSIAYDGPLDAAINYYHTHDYYTKDVVE